MIYLLDTDTIIYWLKGNKNISSKIVSSGFHSVVFSDITKAELYYGAYKSRRTEENLTSIKNLSERVNCLPFSEPAQAQFGKIKSDLEKSGKRLDDMDLMIASIAMAFSLVLVTNNTSHFQRIDGLMIENWV